MSRWAERGERKGAQGEKAIGLEAIATRLGRGLRDLSFDSVLGVGAGSCWWGEDILGWTGRWKGYCLGLVTAW